MTGKLFDKLFDGLIALMTLSCFTGFMALIVYGVYQGITDQVNLLIFIAAGMMLMFAVIIIALFLQMKGYTGAEDKGN